VPDEFFAGCDEDDEELACDIEDLQKLLIRHGVGVDANLLTPVFQTADLRALRKRISRPDDLAVLGLKPIQKNRLFLAIHARDSHDERMQRQGVRPEEGSTHKRELKKNRMYRLRVAKASLAKNDAATCIPPPQTHQAELYWQPLLMLPYQPLYAVPVFIPCDI